MLAQLKKLGILTSMTVMLAMPQAVQAEEFNTAQREEMGRIVREYLIKNPEVLREAFEALERKEAKAKAEGARNAIKSMAGDIFSAPGDLVVGNPEGDITMVEFFDYNCGFCKRSLPDVLKLVETDKKLKFVIKEFPILGPGSTFAARAAIASRLQGKYWEFHLVLMKKRGRVNEAAVLKAAKDIGLDMDRLKKDMASEEVSKIIRRNHTIAQALNINGTPAFIVKNTILPGAVGFKQLSQAIAEARKN